MIGMASIQPLRIPSSVIKQHKHLTRHSVRNFLRFRVHSEACPSAVGKEKRENIYSLAVKS